MRRRLLQCWLMEAPPLLHWLPTWVTAQRGHRARGAPAAKTLSGRRMTGPPRQVSLPVPRTGGHLSQYLYPPNRKPELFFRPCASGAFPSHTYVGGKQKCVRRKPELSTSAHVIWGNRMKSSYRAAPVSDGAGRGPRGRWGFLSLPAAPCLAVLLISSCHHPSARAQRAGLASSCISCATLTGHGCDGTRRSLSRSLTRLGALLASVRRAPRAERRRN